MALSTSNGSIDEAPRLNQITLGFDPKDFDSNWSARDLESDGEVKKRGFEDPNLIEINVAKTITMAELKMRWKMLSIIWQKMNLESFHDQMVGEAIASSNGRRNSINS